MKPICHDLYCGLGGWASAFLSEGYRCIGYDIEKHDYGMGTYPGELVLCDVRSLHGSQLKDAAIIVASPPCQEPSYRAMPWKRAKALNAIGPPHLFIELFNTCFRIQREASEAAGHYIPLIVENVCGAQRWVGRARWHFGSYYLWGDVPALMPITLNARMKYPTGCSERLWKDREIPRLNNGESSLAHREEKGIPHKPTGHWTNAAENGTKQGSDWFGKNCESSMSRLYGSKSKKRKAASAEIARIPFPLARHIAKCFKPHKMNVECGD